jgi:hypothetical protein
MPRQTPGIGHNTNIRKDKGFLGKNHNAKRSKAIVIASGR